MEGQLYPYAAGGTLPPAAEQAGYYNAPVTALAFDAAEELLHVGTEDGRMTVTHAPGLERYAGAHVHPREYQVITASPLENAHGGVVTVSAARACYTSGGCVKRWTVGERQGVDPTANPLTCGAVDTHQLGGSGRAYVGRSSAEMLQIDIGVGRVSLTAELMPGTCSQGTSCIATGAARGLVACGGFGGELVMRDPRNKLRAETQLSSPAHAAGVTAVAAKGDLVITCGLTADRAGVVSVDPFVKVVDVRVGCRVLNVLQFPAGAVAVAFHPKFNGTVVLGGESGLVQTQDADRGGPGSSGAGFFSQAPLDLMGQRLASLAASSSGEAFAFGDTAGYVHLWSVNDQPTVNAYSRAVEDPPRYAACVERAFERAQYEMARLQLAQAGQPPPPPPDAPLADERDPAPEAPFHLSEDGGATPPLAYVDPRAEVAVGRCPHIVPKAVLETARFVDFVGYAPNPHFSRGGARGEAYRRAAPLRNKRAESREGAAEAKRRAATAAKLSTQVGDARGAAATSPLPPLYHRVEVRLSANRARFEEFDFSEHNRTRLVGLVNDLANSYVNPVLQTLHFTPELRAEVLMGHTCEREFCLTCELGFLSHMLAQPPTRGAGSHASSSATAQPLNFLRTLRQVREAAALGLIEGRDELETRLDLSKPRRVQAFQRFILEQLHKEDAGSSSSGAKNGNDETGSVGCVERLFALTSTQTHTCAQCSRVEKRSSRSFQTDLQYPEKKTWRKGSPSNPTFAECLAKSLCTSQEVRAWCEGHGAYTRMAQRKLPKRLPQVLSVNLGMRDPGDLRWWGADVDSHVLSAAARAPVEKHWLPQYVRIAVDEEGESGSSPGGAVRVAQAADDADALEGDGVTYELTSLVCLARRPAEEDDDDSPGGGLDETGAKKLAGHLLSFVKVTPPYVRARGVFDAAPSPPKGESPGVSPLSNAAAARAGPRAAAAGAETDPETGPGAGEPPSTPGPATAPDGDGDAPGSATASEKKAAGLAAALAAGEAMYGENSGFQGLTPSRVEAAPRLDTDWLLFNDFCITPVAAKEVTRLYGQTKLPTLCAYTRVDRPTPKPPPPSPITADVYRRLTLDANLPPRSPFAPFDYESPKETPGVGTLLGIDAEFVSLAPAVKEPGPEGEEIVVQPVRLGLARVSVVRGDPDHPRRLVPVIDDYIRAVEPVHDYLTRFSGLVPGDLDPATSKRHIVKLKHAYLKLRYLIDAGCVFVGHGLKQDFKMINVFVPPAQIVDTVELFHFKRQRKLSLRFLASYLLGADIQKDTHDSIEDARTAVRLYEKYLEMREDGEGAFREKLLEIYRFGKQHGFTGEVRPDNVVPPPPPGAPPAPPPPPGPPPAPPPPPGPPPPSAVPQPRET